VYALLTNAGVLSCPVVSCPVVSCPVVSGPVVLYRVALCCVYGGDLQGVPVVMIPGAVVAEMRRCGLPLRFVTPQLVRAHFKQATPHPTLANRCVAPSIMWAGAWAGRWACAWVMSSPQRVWWPVQGCGTSASRVLCQ
jgi:hypothetical protein